MLFSALAVSSLFVAVAVAGPEPAPYRVGPMMSSNPAHGLAKRQAGYQPTQHYCNGPGDTCASACGAGFVTCASNDDQTHCYDPSAGYTCCTDGTGNSCQPGYYCTEDASGGSWCCPNGMSLAQCAAAYTLTGTLISETGIAAPTSAPHNPTSPPFPTGTGTGVASVSPTSGIANGTITVGTPTASQSQFTGAANANGVVGGLLVLGVAGVFAAL